MSRSAHRRIFTTACLLTGGLLAALAGAIPTAVAAQSDAERAIALTSPAVVFIDTSVSLRTVLTYQNSNTVSGLGSLRRTYGFDWATGSGFVVNPAGTIVTASHVVEPPEQEMHNYGANKMVLEGYGYSYPDNTSSPFDQYTLPVGYQNKLLQQCYKGVACDFTITPLVTVYNAVDIAQNQLPKGNEARILTSTGFENTDVAVLQMNGENLPTVTLAGTANDLASGDPVTALGFPGTSRDQLETGVTEPNKVFGNVSNIRPEGTSKLIEIDADIQHGMSGGPVIDESGDVVGLASFELVQSSGEAGAKYLRTVDDIKAALADAGVTPSHGPVDAAFAKAMDLYWGNHFTASIPVFNQVLALYPGHPLATQYLSDAQANKGTAKDVPVSKPIASGGSSGSGGGFPIWIIAVIGAAVVVVGGVVVATRRSKPAPAPAPLAAVATPAAAPEPVAAVGTPAAAPEPQSTKTAIGFQPRAPEPAGTPSQPEPVQSAAPSSSEWREERAPETSPTVRYCANCGRSLAPGARFCGSCGHELR